MTTTISNNVYLTVNQVAERFGVSTDSIWRWRRQGIFPASVTIGLNCVRWRLADIEDHENQLHSCFMTHVTWQFAA